MALNTNIFQVRTRDFGSERAQLNKAISKAKLAAEGSDPALEQLKRTVESLPKPSEWTYQKPDWKTIMVDAFARYEITMDAPASLSWRDPDQRQWRPEFRRQALARGIRGTESQYMQQQTLAFPPIDESDLFRVEHEFDLSDRGPFGVGPYQRSYQLDCVPYSEQCPETGEDLTPGPYSDGELLPALRAHGHDLNGRCYFGFQNLDAMRSWFRAAEFWESCKRARFVVRHYRGIVFHGRRQSVIDSKYPVQRLGIVSL